MTKEKELAVRMTVKDRATQALDGFERRVQKFSNVIRKYWMGIAAAVAAVGVVFKSSIDAYSRQEDAVRRLNNALELQGFYTDRTSRKYQQFAQEIQRSTRYGDEAVMEMMQQLISVGNVLPSQMERASRAAMDYAAATGKDLGGATLLMAKAMAGATGELGQYGIMLDKNLPAAQKATAALEAMEQKFGGMAQKDIETMSGRVAQLSNAFGDLKESIGRVLVHRLSLDKLVVSIKTVLENMTPPDSEVGKLEAYLERADAAILSHRERMEKGHGFLNQRKVIAELEMMERYRNDAAARLRTIYAQERVEEAETLELESQHKILKIQEEFNKKYQDMLDGTTEGKIAALDQEYQKYAEHIQEKAQLDEWYSVELKKINNKVAEANSAMTEFAKQAARNMQNAFSDFFFRTMKGELDSLQDIFVAFGDSVLQIIANIMAKIALVKIFTAAAGGPTGQIFGVGVDQLFHQGGMVEKYHQGGLVRPIVAHRGLAPDEVPIIAQTGEAVLSRRGVAAARGSDGVRRLNSGQGTDGSGGNVSISITVPMAVQAWDVSDIMRNSRAIGGAVAYEISNNGQIRDIIRKLT